MRRLVLLRHARTASTSAAAFPAAGDDLEPLMTGDVERLREAVATAGWSRDGAACSPLRRARRTAALLGLAAVSEDAALREADFGTWVGRTLAELAAEVPADVEAWMTDPAAAPHGGESLSDVLHRVGAWLDREAARDGRTVAVTHGGVVKAAVVHALAAPAAAFWRIDAAPLHTTELHAHDGRWTVAAVNRPIAT